MRIYLANVGANAGHRLASPLFDDGTFEFLPIPEDDRNLDTSSGAVRFRDLRSYYDSNRDLLSHVPQDLWGMACHNDPEFETFTYGDSGTNPRSSNLTRMEAGDVLLFLARLERKVDGKRGFYLIGGISVDLVLPRVLRPLSNPANDRFARNAHVIRARYTGEWDGFWLFGGSSQSRRFERAVPITREISERVFMDKKGNPWDWSRQTETATIGSYTRTCRCMLDASDLAQAQRRTVLRQWIAKHSGDADAALLPGPM